MIQEAAHLFGGQDGRNALGQFGSGDEARGIFFQQAFANAVFEKRAEGGEFARDGAFLKAVVVEMGDEFADDGVGDGGESGRLKAGRREKRDELAKVLAVVGYCMRRGVLYRLEIFEVLGDGRFHFVPGLAGLLF